uniref:Transmembrane protein n=1 Tax=Toxoplasma gondii TgCATBr9 TaxID=943120 RepID=A0A2T6IRV6_TOXGO|nr:hypothetical protein TGBR9_382550 [Toxoplasma gondii TgCATBr9]
MKPLGDCVLFLVSFSSVCTSLHHCFPQERPKFLHIRLTISLTRETHIESRRNCRFRRHAARSSTQTLPVFPIPKPRMQAEEGLSLKSSWIQFALRPYALDTTCR